jgi:hypothetical protein
LRNCRDYWGVAPAGKTLYLSCFMFQQPYLPPD